MARQIERLTALKVEAKELAPGMYPDGNGLYLRVTPKGARNWVLRYMLDRKPRWMGLGPLSLYGLADARTRALDARRKRHDGIDPIEARRAEADSATSRRRQSNHLQAVRGKLHHFTPCWLAQCEASVSMESNA